LTVYKSLPVADMARLYRSGDTIRALAAKYNVSYGTVRRVLAAAGIPLRRGGKIKDPVNAITRLIEPTYTAATTSIWIGELPTGPLPPTEVDRLRRAVGWRPDWTAPYDSVWGD
jgi:hypothetical protein